MDIKEPSPAALKAFVRKEANRFLKQKNITSIGIGYKIKGDESTEQLSIQFTVGKKVAPEAIESLGADMLPKFLEVEGIQVPTDVLQRNYERGARSVSLEAVPSRKVSVDPIQPGVSIGHPDVSAGTAGCVVYDRNTGAPYVLSNWHVLHGPTGKLGDPTVQPGPWDDNRIERNRAGHLVRSHLGVAGDCAIAAIEHRNLDPKIFDLDVAVNAIGEPELGDLVIKSGRTTNVTYGQVNRIHVTVQIDYDEAGSHQIGCFEIGPSPAHPARQNEISMGGDSGSAWLLVKDGAPSDMMLGLHFAGEVGDAPEHALACYAKSVYEKLGILPAKPAVLVVGDGAVAGYDPNFLGTPLNVPEPTRSSVRKDLLEAGGQVHFDYTHFTLAMSRKRRFARWVAWNIDGGSIRRLSRDGLNFKMDPNLPEEAQIGNELYIHNALDRGHIARRADLVWGTLVEAGQANKDSFFYTNITPQHEAFNRSSARGIWGELENAIFENVDIADLHVSVMSGPIFTQSDPVYRDIDLPKQFWKAIYFRQAGDPTVRVKSYVLTQADLLNQLEIMELPDFAVYEVSLSKIKSLTHLRLPAASTLEVLKPQPERIQEKIRQVGSIREIMA